MTTPDHIKPHHSVGPISLSSGRDKKFQDRTEFNQHFQMCFFNIPADHVHRVRLPTNRAKRPGLVSVKTSPKRPKPSVSFSLSGLPIELTCSANIPLRRLSTIEHTANPLNLIELLDDHLDGHAAAGKANHRNGYSKKTGLTENAKLTCVFLAIGKARSTRS